MIGFKFIATIFLIGATAVIAGAADWSEINGIGIRGPLLAPMLEGSDYGDPSREPFMMGLDGSFYIRYGIRHNLTVDLSIGAATTYDDTTATSDQSFSFNNSDNASSKMTALLVGLTGNYYLLTGGNLQPYLIFGLGFADWTIRNIEKNRTFSVSDFDAKAGLGLNFWLADNFTLDFQGKFSYAVARAGHTGRMADALDAGWNKWKTRPFRAYLEPSIGLTYYLGGGKDTDKDGVKDKDDQCPDTPKGAAVNELGCPNDEDRDGVYDGLDRCPGTPAGAKVDINGCPIDTDKDGVFDGIDRCPDTPANVKVDIHGCPLDGDGDGVPDYLDKQLDTPRGAKVDKDGVGIDSDSDGVYDGIDKCPKTPAGMAVDAQGCPKEIKRLAEKITLNIKYATGSFEPDDASKEILDGVAKTMKAYPDTKIEIAGFTDDVGSEKANLTLSQKRADGVMKYLIDKGVEPERMSAIGHGENPKYFIGDNKTAEGRQKNRRVEINSTLIE